MAENFYPPEELQLAQQAVTRFMERHEPFYRLLLYHAALPLVLTPELLNYLRTKFLQAEVPWVAEADLLLSELCRQVGYEQYVMEPAVRAYLLWEMKQDPTLGQARMEAVARLLIHYVQHLARTDIFAQPHELQAQQWAAMVYIEEQRETAIREIAKALRNTVTAVLEGAATIQSIVNQAEMACLANLTQELAPGLERYPELVKYAANVTQFLLTPTNKSIGEIRELLQIDLDADDVLPSPHESYDVKRFVDRDQELKEIANRIDAGRHGDPIPNPIIHIWGPSGIGKSWLLHHIEHTWDCHPDGQLGSTPIQGDVSVVRAELSDFANAIGTLVNKLYSIGSDTVSNPKVRSTADIHTQTQQCVTQAIRIAAFNILVFLFDSAEKLPEDDFLRLEQELISPLAYTERVIFIVASRKDLTLWQEFKVRQRLEIWELQAFDLETTRKQLARYHDASRALDEIYLFTKGLPHANQLLAAALEERCLSDERKPTYLSQVEADLLQDVAKDERKILRVLSTLRKFNVEFTRRILGEFIDRGFSTM
ncbi:MAG: hypothetical protein RBT75_20940, partial [Anaerolineae bacterium]|nr:hypothetical protein [Anaerolineae bacterium]